MKNDLERAAVCKKFKKKKKQKEYKQRPSKANGKWQMAETKSSISNFDFIFEKQKSEKSFNFYMNSCLKLVSFGFLLFYLKRKRNKQKKKPEERNIKDQKIFLPSNTDMQGKKERKKKRDEERDRAGESCFVIFFFYF